MNDPHDGTLRIALLLKSALEDITRGPDPPFELQVTCFHRFPSGATLFGLELDTPALSLTGALLSGGPHSALQRHMLLMSSAPLLLVGRPMPAEACEEAIEALDAGEDEEETPAREEATGREAAHAERDGTANPRPQALKPWLEIDGFGRRRGQDDRAHSRAIPLAAPLRLAEPLRRFLADRAVGVDLHGKVALQLEHILLAWYEEEAPRKTALLLLRLAHALVPGSTPDAR